MQTSKPGPRGSKLKARGKPYYKVIGPGLHVGYRKGKRAGMWVVRRYAGASTYVVETIAEADDYADAMAQRVLTFWQAQDAARKMSGLPCPLQRSLTRSETRLTTILWSSRVERPYADTKGRLEAYALPALGDRHVDKLTAEMLRNGTAILPRRPGGFGPIKARQNIRPGPSISLILRPHAGERFLPIAFSVCSRLR